MIEGFCQKACAVKFSGNEEPHGRSMPPEHRAHQRSSATPERAKGADGLLVANDIHYTRVTTSIIPQPFCNETVGFFNRVVMKRLGPPTV